MAPNRLLHFRGIRPLLRVITLVVGTVTIILLACAIPISKKDDFYSDGLGPMIPSISLASVGIQPQLHD